MSLYESLVGTIFNTLSLAHYFLTLLFSLSHSLLTYRPLTNSRLGRKRNDLLLGVHILRSVVDQEDSVLLLLGGHAFGGGRHSKAGAEVGGRF